MKNKFEQSSDTESEPLYEKIEALKESLEYRLVPTLLQERLEDDTLGLKRGDLLVAAGQIIAYESMRAQAGFSETDMQLLYRSLNPMDFAKFSRNEFLRLRELKEKIIETTTQQERGE